MQIVININENEYLSIKEYPNNVISYPVTIHLYDAVRNGTPLSKGHGRIADMDEAIKCIEDVKGEDAIWAINLIEWACSKRTIIESDKED